MKTAIMLFGLFALIFVAATPAAAMTLLEAESEILQQISNLEELPAPPNPVVIELGESITKSYALAQGDVILTGLEITGAGINIHMIVRQIQTVIYNKNWGNLPARLTLEVYLHAVSPRDTADIIEAVASQREINFTFSPTVILYGCYPPEEGTPQNLTITGRLLITDVFYSG